MHSETLTATATGRRGPDNNESAVGYIVVLEDYKEVAEIVCDALRSEGHRCFVIRSQTCRRTLFEPRPS